MDKELKRMLKLAGLAEAYYHYTDSDYDPNGEMEPDYPISYIVDYLINKEWNDKIVSTGQFKKSVVKNLLDLEPDEYSKVVENIKMESFYEGEDLSTPEKVVEYSCQYLESVITLGAICSADLNEYTYTYVSELIREFQFASEYILDADGWYGETEEEMAINYYESMSYDKQDDLRDRVTEYEYANSW